MAVQQETGEALSNKIGLKTQLKSVLKETLKLLKEFLLNGI
jgi:hypothetical protein